MVAAAIWATGCNGLHDSDCCPDDVKEDFLAIALIYDPIMEYERCLTEDEIEEVSDKLEEVIQDFRERQDIWKWNFCEKKIRNYLEELRECEQEDIQTEAVISKSR